MTGDGSLGGIWPRVKIGRDTDMNRMDMRYMHVFENGCDGDDGKDSHVYGMEGDEKWRVQ